LFDFIEFQEGANLNEALLMTMGAAGMACLVLITLMTVTIITGRIVAVCSKKPSAETFSEVSRHAIAAAIAVSIATAENKRPDAKDTADPYVHKDLEAGSWRDRGRQDIMDSRLGGVHRR
jgi:hypothetical protein